MALNIQDNNKIIVVLDEQFQGTNVKDAYDGTLMVVKSRSKIKNSFFFILSNILEVAEQVKDSDDIVLKCFESILYEDTATYDYVLKEGVTS